jgi:predicted protein tyrosine phosphatase
MARQRRGYRIDGDCTTKQAGAFPHCVFHWPSINAVSALMKKLLLICSANKLRNPTADQVFSTGADVETNSAGLSSSADAQLSAEQVRWADIIFVTEKANRSKLSAKFRQHLNGKRVICPDIPDDYGFMNPRLVRLLEARVPRHL